MTPRLKQIQDGQVGFSSGNYIYCGISQSVQKVTEYSAVMWGKENIFIRSCPVLRIVLFLLTCSALLASRIGGVIQQIRRSDVTTLRCGRKLGEQCSVRWCSVGV